MQGVEDALLVCFFEQVVGDQQGFRVFVGSGVEAALQFDLGSAFFGVKEIGCAMIAPWLLASSLCALQSQVSESRPMDPVSYLPGFDLDEAVAVFASGERVVCALPLAFNFHACLRRGMAVAEVLGRQRMRTGLQGGPSC